jgi:ATP-binding cassette, subfamily B, bacterial MsbA
MKYLLPVIFHQPDADPRVVAFIQRLLGDSYEQSLLLFTCLGLPVAFLTRGFSEIANRYLMNKAGFLVLENIRLEAFRGLLRLPLAFFQRNTAGDLSTRLMHDTERLRFAMVSVVSDVVVLPATLLFALGYLAYQSATERSVLFAIIAMFGVGLCIMPIRFAARRLLKRARQISENSGRLSHIAIETLQSPIEIQAYNLQAQRHTLFARISREIFRLSLKTIKYQAAVSPTIEMISVIGLCFALFFGLKSGMTFSSFVSLAAALYFAYGPIKKLANVHANLKMGEASLDRLEYILDAEDTVPEPAAPATLPPGPQPLALEAAGFSYAPRQGEASHADGLSPKAALRNISAFFAPGETVALVGKSGAGKSTFVTLIPRFFDPTVGRVTLGGIDLRALDKEALRARIALVPQQPLLFDASFADNIRMGRLNATDAEVEQAARRAHIHDFVAAQPQGYATMVGERGATLSGGQRQRIAIARAFLKDAPLLILDEATSALDSESEAAVQAALTELVKGRLTFMIAHRFSSIRSATRILVFEEGRIVADGPHSTLYASSPAYRELYDRQALGEKN